MVGGDLYAEENLGAMIVKGKGRIDRDSNINKLGDFSDEERRRQQREVAAYGPRSGASSSASCWGLVKDHDLGFVCVDS